MALEQQRLPSASPQGVTSEAALTIGVTCFREGDWLQECWESVISQDDGRWEAVLVIDGNADARTREIFDNIEHPRLRKYAFAENQGPYPVRSKAFEMTRTPYHLYLDGDDILPRNAVRLVHDAAKRHPNAAAFYGDVKWFGQYELLRTHPHQLTPDVLARLDAMPGGGVAYRVDVWRAQGGFAEALMQSGADYDYNIGLVEAGYELVHVGDTVYRYRKQRKSNSESHAYRCWQKHETMVQRHPQFFADDSRRRDFLTRAYEYSFRHLYEAGDLVRAKDVAKRALARGCVGKEYRLMRALSLLPLAVFSSIIPAWRGTRQLFRTRRAGRNA